MSGEPPDRSGEKPLKIRRGRVDSVDLFEIKDSELDLLERGSPADLHLNCSIALLSVAFSAVTALVTVTAFRHRLIETTFIIITVIGFVLGFLLLLLWRRGRTDVSKTVALIRNRIPPDASGAPRDEPEAPPTSGDSTPPVEPKG